MVRFFRLKNTKNLIILSIIAFMISGLIIYKIIDIILHPPLSIVASFEDLGPIYKKMPVYYKGYKIGITKRIDPSKDYKSTLVTINFYPKEPKLPVNIIAKVKTLNTGVDYIDLIYPVNPSSKILSNGDIIQGKTTLDIQSFMNAQADSGTLGSVIDTATQTLNNITETSKAATKLLTTTTATINENRQNIQNVTQNLAKSSANLNEITYNLNSSLDKNKLNNTTDNIEQITENIESVTDNLNTTVDNINSLVNELNSTSKSINDISKDIRRSICKRKGIIGLIMGKRE